jgi:hypothetical protein
LVIDVAAEFQKSGKAVGTEKPITFAVAVTAAPDGNIFIRRNDRNA